MQTLLPLDVLGFLGPVGNVLIVIALGFGFGFVLERAGFGDARKLAAQFYLHDMTVLKVMFTAIVVAMVLVLWSSAFQLLDFERLWVNPTYLGPGVLGGLILGMGFIIGGYCPGTALVAVSTLKIDGAFFVLGVIGGLFAFGEVVPAFWQFYLGSGALGRLTIPEWLGVDPGLIAVIVVAMALIFFSAAERIEVWAKARKEGTP